MIAERSGEPVFRMPSSVKPGNWNATLIVNPVGSADRRAKVRSVAQELQREFDLKPL